MCVIPVEELAAEFPAEVVKTRKGSFGRSLNYLEAHTVIDRLNTVLQGDWSFVIVNKMIEPDEIVVEGKLIISGNEHCQFGGVKIKRNKDTGEVLSLSDDLKAAASDCFKKCCTQVGIGLYLYNSNQKNHINNLGSNGNGSHLSVNRNGNSNYNQNRVTNSKISEIFSLARDIGIRQTEVVNLARQNFNCTISAMSANQAEELIDLLPTLAA